MINIPNYQTRTQIYESANSLVYRGVRKKDNQPVILKVLKEDYPTPEELTRYRQEYDITRRLTDVDGAVKAYDLEKHQNTLVMILEDFGGQSLKIWLDKQRTFTLDELLTFAIRIIDILAQIHGRNIIHKDINPSNIILNPTSGMLKIIDFGISTQFKKQHLTLKKPEVLEGTLAYISPEQTGRMNRALDYRTDFYSLGVTFYELFTGKVPFESSDAMESVHCHIAKTPVPICEVNPNVPPILSDIVMKLMAKNAEDRYQSAWGIKVDLEKCLENLRGFQNLEGLEVENRKAFKNLEGFSFELAQNDFSEQFQIPQKLYGRESEINTLLSGFERVSSGKAEMMLVAGYSGIGKSALVKEIYQSLSEKQGYFISGKFDQLQRNIPYSAVVNAFKELVQQLLTENEERLSVWKEKLLSALSSNGQIIIDVLPEIEWIIGAQPAVPELGPTESQNRFNLVFQNFMRVFCQPEHPLVIFLDDLQWIDSATLKLLEVIMKNDEMRSFFFIGAFRDNEVDANHPFMMTLETLRQSNVPMSQITLKPLNFEHINQLIADTLHENLDAMQYLTRLIMQKTEGNPFFVNQFLQTLYDEELLQFVPPKWQWDIAQIEALNMTDNVVELMVGKLQKLPKASQAILRLAACIGNHFDLDILSIISEKTTTDTFQALMPVLTEGLIVPLSELEITGNDIRDKFDDNITLQLTIHHFRFLHDRVQQAAYTLIDDEQKQMVHLQIGRLLLKNTAADTLEEKVFDIVSHLNNSFELLNDQAEQLKVAQLNLMAGQKAKMSTAYAAARQYLIIGKNCLTLKSWVEDYDLTFALHKNLAEVEYLNGHFDKSETLSHLILEQAKTVLEQAEIYNVLIIQYTMLAKYEKAIQASRTALKSLGIDLPEEELQITLNQEQKTAKANWEHKEIASLIAQPEVDVPEIKMIVKLLVNVAPAAYLSDPLLFTVIVVKIVNISLKYGHVSDCPYGYSTYGMILGSMLGDYQSGYEFGLLALKVSEKFANLAQRSKVCQHIGGIIYPWVKHIKGTHPFLNDGYQSGLESGDLQFSGYCLLFEVLHFFYEGKDLADTLAKIPQFIQFSQQTQNQWITDSILGYQLALSNLAGLTSGKLDFHHEKLSEAAYLEICHAHKSPQPICFYQILKTVLLYLYGDTVEALNYAQEAEQGIACITSFIPVAEHNFYHSLILTALYQEASEKQPLYWEKLEANQKQMKIWADNCPENFQHKYLLVDAEIARLSGKPLEITLALYEQAISSAKENGFIQNEALSNELLAQFWLERDHEKIASIYLKEAHYGYQQWGAITKVKDLEQRYPQFLIPKTASVIPTNTMISMTKISSTSTQGNAGWLDLNSVTKAAQTLSGEMFLERLLEKMMHIVIENAGAEHGFFLLPQQEQWIIEAEGHIDSEEVKILQSIAIENQPIAQTILQYVIRTQENVVLSNASQKGNFTRDVYIIKQHPKSVLCAPLVNQGKLIGILYLENNLTEGAFTPERLEVLKVLSSQLAISIENALLYRTLEQKVEERTAQLAKANEEITTLNEQLKEENLRMSAELEVSRQLQQMLLPKEEELKKVDCLDIAGFMEPAEEVGGDYYDVLQHQGRILFGIGDVTGHGLESGALAIMVQSSIRTLLANNETDLAKFFLALNEMVFHNVQRMNVEKSLTLALVDYQENQLYLSGQHEEMIVVRQGKLELIDTMDLGFPIGLDENIADFVNQIKVPLKAGDVVVLYTDGITEAENLDGQMYELKRLCEIIQQNWQQTAHEIREAVINDVRQFIGEQKVFDDITLLVLKQK